MEVRTRTIPVVGIVEPSNPQVTLLDIVSKEFKTIAISGEGPHYTLVDDPDRFVVEGARAYHLPGSREIHYLEEGSQMPDGAIEVTSANSLEEALERRKADLNTERGVLRNFISWVLKGKELGSMNVIEDFDRLYDRVSSLRETSNALKFGRMQEFKATVPYRLADIKKAKSVADPIVQAYIDYNILCVESLPKLAEDINGFLLKYVDQIRKENTDKVKVAGTEAYVADIDQVYEIVTGYQRTFEKRIKLAEKYSKGDKTVNDIAFDEVQLMLFTLRDHVSADSKYQDLLSKCHQTIVYAVDGELDAVRGTLHSYFVEACCFATEHHGTDTAKVVAATIEGATHVMGAIAKYLEPKV